MSRKKASTQGNSETSITDVPELESPEPIVVQAAVTKSSVGPCSGTPRLAPKLLMLDHPGKQPTEYPEQVCTLHVQPVEQRLADLERALKENIA